MPYSCEQHHFDVIKYWLLNERGLKKRGVILMKELTNSYTRSIVEGSKCYKNRCKNLPTVQISWDEDEIRNQLMLEWAKR